MKKVIRVLREIILVFQGNEINYEKSVCFHYDYYTLSLIKSDFQITSALLGLT